MPIFRAHTCSTLTVPDRRSRSSSKGSNGGLGGLGGLRGSSPSARELRRTGQPSSPSSLPASRFSSESRARCGSGTTGLDAFLSSETVPRSPRPSSSASRSSLRSTLSSQNLSLSSSPLASSPMASPLVPPSPSSPHPRSLRDAKERERGSKERDFRSEKEKMEKDRQGSKEDRESKETKEGIGRGSPSGRGSIQLPHLKPKEPKEPKEPQREDEENRAARSSLTSMGSFSMLPRPKTVEARMEARMEERTERPEQNMGFAGFGFSTTTATTGFGSGFGVPVGNGLTPQEQLVNLFSGATRKNATSQSAQGHAPRLRPERLEPDPERPDRPEESRAERPERPERPETQVSRPSSKYRYGKTSGRRPPPSPTQAVSQKKIQRLEEGQKIFDLYYWEEILQQEGDGGKVVVCRPKRKDGKDGKDGQDENEAEEKNGRASFRFVMKIKSKEALRQDMHEKQFVRAQLRLLNLKAPPGVIQLQEILEDENFYYVVMDRATGGSFFSSLLEEYPNGTMPASAVCKVARDILETLRHLHKEGILHRDIKPDNMVMHALSDASGKKLQKVTLIDFDHADAEFSGLGLTQVQHCFGTARFNAPEAFLGFYSAATDLYSVGVIVYLLLTGSMPYPSELFEFPTTPGSPSSPAANRRWMKQVVVTQMEAHHIDWSHPTFREIPDSRDFCQHLLAYNVTDRFATAEEALRHPWISSESLE